MNDGDNNEFRILDINEDDIAEISDNEDIPKINIQDNNNPNSIFKQIEEVEKKQNDINIENNNINENKIENLNKKNEILNPEKINNENKSNVEIINKVKEEVVADEEEKEKNKILEISLDIKKINKIILKINSGIISHIYSHLMSGFSDFSGIFLGNHKVIREIKPIDSNEKNEIIVLNLIIESVIFIHDRKYEKQKLDKLLNKINEYYQQDILGIFTGKSFSYPQMSLKEYDFYMNANKINLNFKKTKYKNDDFFKIFPLLFGAFAQNENKSNGIKMQTFNSKFYYFNSDNNLFNSLPYDIICMKDTSYIANMDNPIPFKVSFEMPKFYEDGAECLKNLLNEQYELINNELGNNLSQILKELKKETKNYIETSEKYGTYCK